MFHTRMRNDALGGPNPFEWKKLTSEDVFAGKRIVLFGVPGAFTPACSESHLPGFEQHYDAFRDLGIDAVLCVSVNDAFVMHQWALSRQVEKVTMLPDGNGEFTRKMGMLVDKSNLGFGMRSWRYSMLVDDGHIEKMFVEPEFGDNCPVDPFEVSDADTMMAYLKGEESGGVAKPSVSFVG